MMMWPLKENFTISLMFPVKKEKGSWKKSMIETSTNKSTIRNTIAIKIPFFLTFSDLLRVLFLILKKYTVSYQSQEQLVVQST